MLNQLRLIPFELFIHIFYCNATLKIPLYPIMLQQMQKLLVLILMPVHRQNLGQLLQIHCLRLTQCIGQH